MKRKGSGLHAAIIMDGNGRWALARGRSRMAGHEAGAEAVRRTVEAAPGLGIAVLTSSPSPPTTGSGRRRRSAP